MKRIDLNKLYTLGKTNLKEKKTMTNKYSLIGGRIEKYGNLNNTKSDFTNI